MQPEIELGPLTLQSFGLMMGLGFVVAGWLASKRLKEIGLSLSAVPKGFHIHRTVKRFLDGRRKMTESGRDIDWSMGEALAFATLL